MALTLFLGGLVLTDSSLLTWASAVSRTGLYVLFALCALMILAGSVKAGRVLMGVPGTSAAVRAFGLGLVVGGISGGVCVAFATAFVLIYNPLYLPYSWFLWEPLALARVAQWSLLWGYAFFAIGWAWSMLRTPEKKA